jgi:hypothetical protein
MSSAGHFIRLQREQRWAKSTLDMKNVALSQFRSFLTSQGIYDELFGTRDFTIDKSRALRLQEEDSLAAFALLRLMAGQTPKGALQYVSHIRTAYEHIWGLPFGYKGVNKEKSYTSSFVWSFRDCFPIVTDDDKRDPVTMDILQLLVNSATIQKNQNLKTVMALAWGSLYRMGELTATKEPFDYRHDLKETDVLFFPDVWNAKYILIKQGRTKTDPTGVKTTLHPRVVPVNDHELNAGSMIRRLLATRHGWTHGYHNYDQLRETAPLFQQENGKQLTQRQVLDFMRTVLRKAGLNETKFGTHSFRIGGFNRLFNLKVPVEQIKRLGGWASDAWKEYIRCDQTNRLEISSAMTLSSPG